MTFYRFSKTVNKEKLNSKVNILKRRENTHYSRKLGRDHVADIIILA